MRVWSCAVIIGAFAVLATSCLPVNSPRDSVYQELQSLNKKLDEQNRQTMQKLQTLETRVAELSSEYSGQSRGGADSSYALKNISEQLDTIKEQLRDSSQQTADLLDKFVFLQNSLMTLRVQMQGGPTSPTTSQSTITPGGPGATGADPETIYQMALADYNKGNYDLAIKGFEQFIQKFPTTELAGNAQYWIGESYYSMQKYTEAMQAFDKVLATYPNNAKAPSALLKIGFCYQGMNKLYDAKKQFSLVKIRYPSSREAQLAEQRLQQLQ